MKGELRSAKQGIIFIIKAAISIIMQGIGSKQLPNRYTATPVKRGSFGFAELNMQRNRQFQEMIVAGIITLGTVSVKAFYP